ncbi:MAG TPA: type II secretion system protein GspG [Myxococcaceae bacterium]|jgi:general secretion pathway protein G
MAEHTASQNAALPARPSRVGRIVVGCVVVLATALAFGVARLTEDDTLSPKQRQARAKIRQLDSLFKSHHRIMGRFPSEQEGFSVLINAKLLDAVPVDPWGRPYVYRYNDKHSGVVSYGEDGVPGGQGDNSDINSGGREEAQR